MFQGKEIKDLVELLNKRGAYLYHACQLLDFQSYLNVGGIPSRSHLESTGQPYTRFETDKSDRSRNGWGKVFGNLQDFGRTFASGGPAVPNSYGPILFQIKPETFYEATDVAICLRSAGRPGFNREKEALSSIEDIDRLFEYPVEHSKKNYVKTAKQLQKQFSLEATAPEISCTVVSGIFPLHYVNLVRVEPYIINEHHLQCKVKEIISNSSAKLRVYQRDRCPTYTDELLKFLEKRVPSLQDLCQEPNVSPELKNWVERVINQGIEYQFNRFARYLYYGTVSPILKGKL